MAVVEFTRNLARHLECPRETVSGNTVATVLQAYFARHPAVRSYVLDEQGSVRHHVVLFVDGTQLANRRDLQVTVRDESVLSVMQALSGG